MTKRSREWHPKVPLLVLLNYSSLLSSNFGIGLPEDENATSAGAALGTLPKLPPLKLPGVLGAPKLGAAGAWKLLGAAGAGLKPVVIGVAGCSPPLFAPCNFSCVRPNAAIPRTAPIAIWNNPAPCSVNGCHCVIVVECVTACNTLHKIGNTTKSNAHTAIYSQPII